MSDPAYSETAKERDPATSDVAPWVPTHGRGVMGPVWKPGQSGNPSGKGGALRDAQRLAQQSTPKAIRRLIDMLDSKDDRVVVVAANALWEKAGGKVLENAPEPEPEKRLDLSKSPS